jgi:hypothetical protein
MTRESLWLTVRNGFDNAIAKKKLDKLLSRNFGAIEEYLESAHVGAGQLEDGSVGESALADDSVHDRHVHDVSIDKVTGGTLGVSVRLDGEIVAGTVAFDANGILDVDEDGAVQVRIGSDGSEPFWRGQVEATALLVDATASGRGAEFRGPGHLFAAGSTVILGGAATGTGSAGDPAAAPGLASYWDKIALSGPANARGLTWDATNTSYWSIDGADPIAVEIDANGTALRSLVPNGAVTCYGAVRVGTRVYVLMRNEDGKILLRTYLESNLSNLDQRNVEFGIGVIHGEPGIGSDGTNIFIVDLDAETAGKVRFHKFTLADEPAFVSTTVSSGAGNPTFQTNRAGLTSFVAAESKWWVSIKTHGQGGSIGSRAEAWSTSAVYDDENDFTNGQGMRGLAHDGTRFQSLGSTEIVSHSNWNEPDANATRYIGYTYVDDNGAASVGARPLGAGDFETKKSPTAKITLGRRQNILATAAPVDTALTGITHVGWYMEDGTTEPTLDYVADSAVTTGVATQKTFSGFTGGGAAPPATNTFLASAAGNNARFTDSSGITILDASGLPRLRLRTTAALSLLNDTDRYIRFGTEDKDTMDAYGGAPSGDGVGSTVPVNSDITLDKGSYIAQLRGVFDVSSGNGRREAFLEIGGVKQRETIPAGGTTVGIRHTFTFDFEITADNTVLNPGFFQNSGASINVNTSKLFIYRIGPE